MYQFVRVGVGVGVESEGSVGVGGPINQPTNQPAG